MKAQNLLRTTLTTLLACSCSVATAKGKIFSFESDAGGFNTKTIFYDNGKEVVAFDSQFTEDAALKALSYMRTQTQSRLRYLVITHPNPDKFNALSVYQKAGAEVVASRQTRDSMPAVHAYKKAYFVNAGMFTEETYPKAGTIDRIFDDKVELKLAGGDLVELSELGRPGVSSNQTVAYVPA
ncbi:MAG: hypothetical protein M3Q07_10405, partial [Pseudobdellovibrionaceae bacterium]|nr:hypothetical protein [Pseudobdellovibrionaceae bacterium]